MAGIQDILGGDPSGILATLGPMAKGQFLGQNWGQIQAMAQSQLGAQTDQIAQQRAEAQAAAQQAATVRQMRQAAIENPSPDTTTALLIADPKSWQASKAAFDATNESHQNAMLQSASSLYGLLSNAYGADGTLKAQNITDAKDIVQSHIDADRKGKKDTTSDEAFLKMIDSDPKAALGSLSFRIGSWMGPDRFHSAFSALSTDQRDKVKENEPLVVQLGNGAIASVDRKTGKLTSTYQEPKQAPAGWRMGKGGSLEPIPGGPADTDYIARSSKARAKERTEGPATTSRVLGGIYDKMARGMPLNPGEQRLYDDHKGAGALGGLLGGNYGDEENSPAAAQTQPQTPQSPTRGPAASQPSKARGSPPAAAVAQLSEGMNATFSNGQVWTLKGGHPVQVK